MKKLSQYTIHELERFPKSRKIKVCAGGEIRTRTIGWLLKQKKKSQPKGKEVTVYDS